MKRSTTFKQKTRINEANDKKKINLQNKFAWSIFINLISIFEENRLFSHYVISCVEEN